MFFMNNNDTDRQLTTHKRLDKKSGLSALIQRNVAVIGLIAISPVLLLVTALIRLDSPGKALYSQTRVGESGRRFTCYKFRSMRTPEDPSYIDVSDIKSDRDGVCNKLYDDPRVTLIGKVIRKFSIDELPQLLNVVKGDMLLIGPRPALIIESDQYSMRARQRLETMPGLTGLWQVSGRADTSFEEQISLDIRYVKEQSWFNDLKILLSTIPVVLLGKGAY